MTIIKMNKKGNNKLNASVSLNPAIVLCRINGLTATNVDSVNPAKSFNNTLPIRYAHTTVSIMINSGIMNAMLSNVVVGDIKLTILYV